MEEEKNNVGGTVKTVLKSVLRVNKKKILIVILIAVFILGLIPALYIKFKDDFKKVSETNATYSASVDSSGKIIYKKVVNNEAEDSSSGENEEGEPATVDDMVEEYKEILGEYIDADEEEELAQKIKYIIEAETVTKLPYIEPSERENSEEVVEGAEEDNEEKVEDSEEEPLIGQIKFYRYNDDEQANKAYTEEGENDVLNEEYRLTYITPEEFETQKSNYESNGDEEVYKHFTMNDSGNVVIAYGSVETRNLITNGDSDMTEETVREASGEEGYTGNYKDGFSMVKYTINEKPIDYISLVEQYIMPSNFLFALLIQTKDIDFVEAVAKLAYENEIAIGIYDNLSEDTLTETYKYKKLIEYTLNTELKFDNVKTTNPKITATDIENKQIPYKCEMNMKEHVQSHNVIYYRSKYNYTTIPQSLYIKEMDSNGVAENLVSKASAKDFTINFTKKINAKSVPTTGVILADTWIAKWKATYTKEDNPPIDSATSGENEKTEIQTYSTKDAFLNAFSENTRETVSGELYKHVEDLRTEAIKVITSNFKPNSGSLKEDEKKEALGQHINSCSQCRAKIPGLIGSVDITTLDYIYHNISTNSYTYGYPVETHYQNAISKKVNEKNQVASENFKKELNNALNTDSSYEQTITAAKYDVDITFTSVNKRISSTYKKEEKTERANDGEKFSEVFNNQEFYDAKQAILKRDQWLWEYIRENEDTEKLEDVIRYLLNIATNSNRFGTFTEEDIENLFKAFEPKDTIKLNGIYGGSVQERLWFALIDAGCSEYAAAGVLGNIEKESAFKTNNLEYKYEKTLGFSDEEYTNAVNSGVYGIDMFKNDRAGYGLAQWTYPTRKENLYVFADKRNVGIDDINMQIEYLLGEIFGSEYADGLAYNIVDELDGTNNCTRNSWMNANSASEAAKQFCWIFENPLSNIITDRQRYAEMYYEQFHGKTRSSGISGTIDIQGYEYELYTSSRTGRTYIWYYQNYGPWKNQKSSTGDTLAKSGCCMTASAIIASGYGDTRVPQWGLGNKRLSKADSNSKGCSNSGRRGVTLNYSQRQEIQNWLFSGKEVLIHVGKNSGYTRTQHWMPLVDISEDGLYIYNMDTYPASKSLGWCSLESLAKDVDCYYLINGLK